LDTFVYFAYGSNILPARLSSRCPSARFSGVAKAIGWSLAFTKPSLDGSGKATLLPADASSSVIGALFEIALGERRVLDRAEGDRYQRNDRFPIVRCADNEVLVGTTYIARPEVCRPELRPYDWYADLILAGARQLGFPKRYLAELQGVESIPDPEPNRPTRLHAIGVLAGLRRGNAQH
jgi:hypothetical protein